VRILVLGVGVIGSVYAAKLMQAGHEVVMLARGRRVTDLRVNGLVLQDAESGDRSVLAVRCVSEVSAVDRFDWSWSRYAPSSS
jgi:2-dehydropantoate 2-reductase